MCRSDRPKRKPGRYAVSLAFRPLARLVTAVLLPAAVQLLLQFFSAKVREAGGAITDEVPESRCRSAGTQLSCVTRAATESRKV
jgi:hypothetical protein